MRGAIWLVRFDGTTEFLVEHRSSSCGYWVQPRATISADARHVVFDSDVSEGSRSSCETTGDDLGRGDVWLVRLEAGG